MSFRSPRALILLCLTASAYAQASHEIRLLQTNAFDPQDLSIRTGDTVRWVWDGGASHNVVSGEGPPGAPGDGELFDSGPPTTQAGTTFEHTFTQAGAFPYYSEQFYFVNMRGLITATGTLPDPEGAGEGEGEPGDATCAALAQSAADLVEFQDLSQRNDDLDEDGIPDIYQIALIEFAACDTRQLSEDLRTATRAAFAANLTSINRSVEMYAKGGVEIDVSLGEFPDLFAALSLISADMQSAVNEATIEPLAADLEVVLIADGAATGEAFAGTGDFDGDGATNAEEFQIALAEFGTPELEEFIDIVATSLNGPGEGGDEEPMNCMAMEATGSPARPYWTDLLPIAVILILLMTVKTPDPHHRKSD